jgi:indolepyruvate ferredoxin oxidoreductase
VSADRALVDEAAPDAGELRRLLEIRVADLRGWGGAKAARRYVSDVTAIRDLEAQRLPGSTVVTEAYAVGLHKLMAYKDEYEVARLHLDGLRELPAGAKVTFLLHPPLLRAMGRHRKMAFGRWSRPLLAMLRSSRRLRGTALDPFGHTAMRRLERELPGEYTALVTEGLNAATPQTAATVRQLAALPDVVRGYEELKFRNVERYRADARALLGELRT